MPELPVLRQFTEYPPLCLYIHFPWCERKCPYCDFNSHPVRDELPEQRYIDALIADLAQHAPDIWGRPVEAIFFGGGTPSLISAAGIDRLLGQVRALCRLQPDAEITLEANPGSVEQQRFSDYRASGINRLSLGIQSFNDQHLQALGRIHDADSAQNACNAVVAAGFDNFNIDLMHGLPGQSLEQAGEDLTRAIAARPSHISYYQLTLEPNTLFAKRPPDLPDDDTLWSVQEQGHRLLSAAGYDQYEVSAFSRAHRHCRHNLNYWLFGDYLGLGAGAHSKLTIPAQSCIERFSKQRHPEAYMDNAGSARRIQARQALSAADSRLEFMMNALRLRDGFATELFMHRTGEPISVLQKPLEQAEQAGLLDHGLRQIRPTDEGLQYLNSLLELFVPDEQASTAPQSAQVVEFTTRA